MRRLDTPSHRHFLHAYKKRLNKLLKMPLVHTPGARELQGSQGTRNSSRIFLFCAHWEREFSIAGGGAPAALAMLVTALPWGKGRRKAAPPRRRRGHEPRPEFQCAGPENRVVLCDSRTRCMAKTEASSEQRKLRLMQLIHHILPSGDARKAL